LPWHVHDDLAACLGLPRDARRQFRQRKIGGPFKGDVRTVATASGIVTIAPHFAAQGLIGAAIEAGMASIAFDDQYSAATIAAFKVITGDLPPMAAVELAIAATKTSLETGS
jgi:ethanolamine utilization microcompartment shell protein EutS